MFRVLTATAVVALGLAAAQPAAAFDMSAMTDEERTAFRAEIRDYLLENPEVLMEAISVLEDRRNNAQAENDASLVAAHEDDLFQDGRSWVGGNPEGDVTLVEFMDYRCGYCKKAFPEVGELLTTDGNIRFIVKEFPVLGEASVLAARFAIAVRNTAGDASYATVHDTLMTLRGDITETALKTVAERQGLDWATIQTAMQAPEVQDEIEANYQLGSALQINGTPGFIFEDQIVRGYVPLDAMQQIVAQIRG